MLQNLHVKNLALIDETEVDFKEGLNILSGETGAGKSIIIGSINLALGEKVQKEMLRENGENALVELVFSVENEAQKKALEELDVVLEDDYVILSRKIANGRGVAKINGESVPASKMREVAGILIDIHGQHEHQSLLHKKKHLEILDEFAKEALAEKKEILKNRYTAYKGLLEELNRADVDEEERLREASFLEYEIKEISEAKLQDNEDEIIEEEYKRYRNGKKIMDALHVAYQYSGNGGENASDFTTRALKELQGASAFDEKVRELEAQMLEIDNLLNDFNREIADYIDETEFDDETFYELEKRLDEINRLKSKYGKSIADILAALAQKEARLVKLQDYDAYLAILKGKVADAEKELRDISMEVSAIRQKYAKELVTEVTSALQELNFLDVRFEMQFEELAGYTANGLDEAEFLISTNPGEPVKSLGKVASGGELSRIMLAIKTILADNDAIETLIFDEIDSGISGRTAQMVSEKMNTLGRNHQIICITHLPQIAAMADAHYLIEKSVENSTTVSKIRLLNDEERVDELSRMLGGVEITDKVRESAREMRELALQKKV
ncbi:MAG: DNA repair protein RecN [Lachnospiraceae bacterium]|nr:DNA repair protein RecN [Lachnospiraceae bacterium]